MQLFNIVPCQLVWQERKFFWLRPPMSATPMYTPGNVRSPAFHLRYGWTVWPTSGTLFPAVPNNGWEELDESWEEDGIRRLEMNWTESQLQMTCSVTPQVSPVLFASRMKGRLQHWLRLRAAAFEFSRKLAIRTIGENHRSEVEAYISSQVSRESFVDSKFANRLQQFTVRDQAVNLALPSTTNSGRYWYNLHLVLVRQGRHAEYNSSRLAKLRDTCFRIAAKHAHCISALSVMPDHLHLALRGNVKHSPEGIALSFMNNLAYVSGRNAIWEPSYYVGTFGEYDMNAVREFAPAKMESNNSEFS